MPMQVTEKMFAFLMAENLLSPDHTRSLLKPKLPKIIMQTLHKHSRNCLQIRRMYLHPTSKTFSETERGCNLRNTQNFPQQRVLYLKVLQVCLFYAKSEIVKFEVTFENI